MDLNKYWNFNRDDYSSRPTILFQQEHLPFLNDCEKIIDLGSGIGHLVSKLRGQGKCAYGITYNKDEVENPISDGIVLGDMQDIPFCDGFFDAFVMWDTLEHCQSAYISLCEAKRVIREGGKGLIFMPGQNWLNCHCHICCYTMPQMSQLFRQAGLELNAAYPKNYASGEYAEGMAIYEVIKNKDYIPHFEK